VYYVSRTDREAFTLTHKDISPNDDGTINLRVTKGKTGFRHSFSTELGLDFYNHLKRINCAVNQLERFYLKRMKVSKKQRENLNRFDSTE
jgi:hypothetical protein